MNYGYLCGLQELASSVVDRGSESRTSQAKDSKICICCISSYHASLKSKSKDWLARNQDNVFEWSDMSIYGPLFQRDSTVKIHQSVLVYYKADIIIISSNVIKRRYHIVIKRRYQLRNDSDTDKGGH